MCEEFYPSKMRLKAICPNYQYADRSRKPAKIAQYAELFLTIVDKESSHLKHVSAHDCGNSTLARRWSSL